MLMPNLLSHFLFFGFASHPNRWCSGWTSSQFCCAWSWRSPTCTTISCHSFPFGLRCSTCFYPSLCPLVGLGYQSLLLLNAGYGWNSYWGSYWLLFCPTMRFVREKFNRMVAISWKQNNKHSYCLFMLFVYSLTLKETG